MRFILFSHYRMNLSRANVGDITLLVWKLYTLSLLGGGATITF